MYQQMEEDWCVVHHASKYVPPMPPFSVLLSMAIVHTKQTIIVTVFHIVDNNDDWYWLHGAVVNGSSCYVISNDQMRDHNFSMLRPRAFLKWRERHQVRLHWFFHVTSPISYASHACVTLSLLCC